MGLWIINIPDGRGLLLADAVDGAHAPHERLAVDGHDAPAGEQGLQDVDGALIVGVAEDRK